VKRSALKDYRNVNRSGIIAILLQEDDRLIDVLLTSGEDHVLLASASGMAIRFDENDARVMGRSAAGVRGMDLREGDEIVGVVRCDEGADLLTVTERGYGKRTPLSEYLVQSEDGSSRPQSRGGKGRIDIRTTERNGSVASVRCVVEGDGLMLVSEGGMVVRIAVDTVSRIGRNTQGVRVARVKDGDRLVATARIEATLMADEETEAPPAEEPSTDETPASGDAPASDEPSAGGTPTA
jgi:DNA gyrase subunit A